MSSLDLARNIAFGLVFEKMQFISICIPISYFVHRVFVDYWIEVSLI
jgi:hypothetical protein